MTADIELLPLPKWLLEGFTDATIEMLCDYTYACVVQATAPRDAEIERLRALLLETCDDGDEADAGLLATLGRARTAEARAERLAEALRFYADTNNWVGRFVTDPTTPAEEDGGDIARESLRDHDQEVGNGRPD